ncbi:hypothetical protein OAF93_01855 [Planctomycetota bacterium]|nr:hypothetical protein [Planctomycetota bacterium]MDB4736490.1 hypothetical protein [Planctomycetota bacterium]
MSYRYHGIATLRELASSNSISTIRRRPLGGGRTECSIKIRNGVHATTIEPRAYADGRITIKGSKGIAEFGESVPDQQSDYAIGLSKSDSGWLQGLTLNGDELPEDTIDRRMASLPLSSLEDQSSINRLKIRGYAQMLSEIAAGSNPYSIVDGLYDYTAAAISERLGGLRDPSLSNGKSSLLRRLLGIHGPSK